jgi:tetratricopeptide (TPR) repeat protein
VFFNRRQQSGAAAGAESGDLVWQDFQNLIQMRPAEVVGHWMEPMYFLWKVNELLSAGEPTEARRLLRDIVKRFSQDFSVRYHSARLFLILGDEAEAAAQLGIALVLEPSFSPAYSELAYLLLRRGETEAAVRLLETGWAHQKHLVARKEHPEQREQYFSAPKRRLAAHEYRNVEGA